MGLDMYLILEDKETKVTIEYAYYRKFNALQGYFERQFKLDNGGKVLLSQDNVHDIYILLNEISYAPERASEMLPTFPGPFFGTYDYDKLYYSYISKAVVDFYHAKYLDFNKYNLYFTSDW